MTHKELETINQMMAENPLIAEIIKTDPASAAMYRNMQELDSHIDRLKKIEKIMERLKLERDAALNLSARYKKALTYYADQKNWEDGRPMIAMGDMDALPDNGDLARAALGPA